MTTFDIITEYSDEQLQVTCDRIGAPIRHHGREFFPKNPWRPGLGGGSVQAPVFGAMPVGDGSATP